MNRRNKKFDPLLVISLIVTCMRNNQMNRIDHLWDPLLSSLIVQPLSLTKKIKHWDYIVSGLCRSGRGDKVVTLMDNIQMSLSSVTLNTLLNSLAKKEMNQEAKQILQSSGKRFNLEPDALHYSCIIKGICSTGNMKAALELVDEMEQKHLVIDSVLFTILCKGCASTGDLNTCDYLNLKIQETHKDVPLINSMIAMNLKCGKIDQAEKLIRQLLDSRKATVITFDVIIIGFGHLGDQKKATHYFNEMKRYGLAPTESTISNLMNACASDSEFVFSLFQTIPANQLNIFHYNALIKSYVLGNRLEDVIQLITTMPNHIPPDDISFTVVASGCAATAAKGFAQKIQHLILSRNGVVLGIQLMNTLLHMNFKTARVDEAEHLFQSIESKQLNTVTFNTMINGYGLNGRGRQALWYYNKMLELGFTRTQQTLVSVLNACSHCGLIDEAEEIFKTVNEMSPPIVNCIIDLYSRSGNLERAVDVLEKYSNLVNYTSYMSILGGCRQTMNVDLAERIFQQMVSLKQDASSYILMANIYSSVGMFEKGDEMRKQLSKMGIKKVPGVSNVEIDGKVHTFYVEHKEHEEIDEIYKYLNQLNDEIQQAGYKPDLKWVIRDLEDGEKRNLLCKHSEKIALAYALMKSQPGEEIMLTKNLRVCGDCHNATKFISMVKNRVIHVRDANRFHRFENGQCSCGDHW